MADALSWIRQLPFGATLYLAMGLGLLCFGIYGFIEARYRKVNPPGASDYLMDHSSFIYLVGPDGWVRQLFRPNTPPETIAAAIRGQLRQL